MNDFSQLVEDLTAAIETVPQRVATEAVNFSKERFQEQAWKDEGKEAWKKRKTRRRGGAKRQKGAVLVDSGRLKRSVRIISVSKDRVLIGTDVPCAEIHNEGFDGIQSVKAHTRRTRNGSTRVSAHTRHMRMPRRRFIGESATLNKRIELMITAELVRALKKHSI